MTGIYRPMTSSNTRPGSKVTRCSPIISRDSSSPGADVHAQGGTARTATDFITEISGKTSAIAAALGSHAGLVSTMRSSDALNRFERVPLSGSQRSKRPLFPSAFSPVRFDQTSHEFFTRKRAHGNRRNQALIVLTHRRRAASFALTRVESHYDSPRSERCLI